MIDLNKCKTIVISRTDAIGDVILTLPLAGIIKTYWPHLKVIFLAKNYTLPIVKKSKYIDEVWSHENFINLNKKEVQELIHSKNIDVFFHIFPNKFWSKVIKKAKVPFRVGTARRLHHLLNCNYKVNLSRKQSDDHELELNIKLLKQTVLGFPELESLKPYHQFFGLSVSCIKKENTRKHVVLHPGSRGSSKDWPLYKFVELSEELSKNKYTVYISGTEAEGQAFRSSFSFNENIIDLSGTMNLDELTNFIAGCDGLVANSTGPLHIAAAVGIQAIGIYPPARPLHPGRWGPVGDKAEYIVADKPNCQLCRKTKNCFCVESISVQQVLDALK